MRMDLRASLTSGAAVLCFLGMSQLAVADPNTDSTKPMRVAEASPPSRASGTSGIETVVVTAEKREEVSQKVAIPLTALDGGALDSKGIISFEDLGTRVPSLRFGAGVTSSWMMT